MWQFFNSKFTSRIIYFNNVFALASSWTPYSQALLTTAALQQWFNYFLLSIYLRQKFLDKSQILYICFRKRPYVTSTKQSGTPTEAVPNQYSIMLANCEHFWPDLLHYQQKKYLWCSFLVDFPILVLHNEIETVIIYYRCICKGLVQSFVL